MMHQATGLKGLVQQFKLDESYVRAAEQQAAETRMHGVSNHSARASTGTYGRTSAIKRTAKPDLKLSVLDKSDDNFEEF